MGTSKNKVKKKPKAQRTTGTQKTAKVASTNGTAPSGNVDESAAAAALVSLGGRHQLSCEDSDPHQQNLGLLRSAMYFTSISLTFDQKKQCKQRLLLKCNAATMEIRARSQDVQYDTANGVKTYVPEDVGKYARLTGIYQGERIVPRESRARRGPEGAQLRGFSEQSAIGTQMKENTRTADGNQSQSKQARQAYDAPGWPLSSPMHSQIDLDSARRVCEAEVEMEQVETGWITPAMAGDERMDHKVRVKPTNIGSLVNVSKSCRGDQRHTGGQGRLKGQSNCTIASQGEGEGMRKRGERKKEKMFGFERALNDLEVGTIF
ncbi:hypothetical protein K438DRAFT_1755475 [Mycena galopus ATCC 62051]|nr:hypothetical protein K438DRAFT_1755475 [Mycena galopus ATCC 62051]